MNTVEIDEIDRLVRKLKKIFCTLVEGANDLADCLENLQRLRDKAEIRAAQDATPSGRTARSDGTD